MLQYFKFYISMKTFFRVQPFWVRTAKDVLWSRSWSIYIKLTWITMAVGSVLVLSWLRSGARKYVNRFLEFPSLHCLKRSLGVQCPSQTEFHHNQNRKKKTIVIKDSQHYLTHTTCRSWPARWWRRPAPWAASCATEKRASKRWTF